MSDLEARPIVVGWPGMIVRFRWSFGPLLGVKVIGKAMCNMTLGLADGTGGGIGLGGLLLTVWT